MADVPLVEVKVLFFAKARELCGKKESFLQIPQSVSYVKLLSEIVKGFSLQSIQQSIILAINEEYATSETEIHLKPGDQVAVIPPLSGDLVSSPSCGAISLFVGTTRDNFDNKQVVQLEYEAYEPMALKAMKKICEEIRGKWQVGNIAIYHRLGIVPVKEASVVIAVSSPHRAEALQAVQFAIDSLKSSTPIWKKEVYASEEGQWKENKECTWTSKVKIKREIKAEPIEGIEDPVPVVSNQTLEYCSAPSDVPPHLIQIKAGAEEIARRIKSFIERKREQVNVGNIQDFCFHDGGSENEYSCARVDALLIRRKDSKSHLRVRRVLNTWGPQTRGIDPGSMGCTNPEDPLNALVQPNTVSGVSTFQSGTIKREPPEEPVVPQGIEERISNAESHLKINGPVPQDIYTRLKQIEDKILHLEGLSPEYFQFWENMPFEDDFVSHRPVKKRMYTTSDLDNKICDLEYKLSMKGNSSHRQ